MLALVKSTWSVRMTMYIIIQLQKIASLIELIIILLISYTLPKCDWMWQSNLEIVGKFRLMKLVGLAAENRKVLYLKYSKGTKITSTIASFIPTIW